MPKYIARHGIDALTVADVKNFINEVYCEIVYRNELIDKGKIEIWLSDYNCLLTPCTTVTHSNIPIIRYDAEAGYEVTILNGNDKNIVTSDILYDYLLNRPWDEEFLLEHEQGKCFGTKIEFLDLKNINTKQIILLS